MARDLQLPARLGHAVTHPADAVAGADFAGPAPGVDHDQGAAPPERVFSLPGDESLPSRAIIRSLPNALAIAIVLTAYAFFGSDGTFEFRRVSGHAEYDRERGYFGRGYYPNLTEGFVRFHLSMAETPHPRLVALRDPWNPEERGRADAWGLWDASYYRGKYYMYWTAVPVFLLYIPFRLVARGYPSEGLAATFFAAWAFIAAVLFIRRALAGRKPQMPMPLWILLLGLGNFIPFVLVFARTYEVANLAGTAMSATWAWALLRFLQSGERRHAFWMGLWLGLAVAARPNAGVLVLPAAAAFFAMEKSERWRAARAALLPFATISLLLIAYNVARFGEPFEFGTKYQITIVSMLDRKVCGLCTASEVARFANNVVQYLAAPVGVWSQFPFAVAYNAQLDPATMFPAATEQTAGVGAMIPLTIVGSLAALLLVALRERVDPATRAAILVIVGGWLVMLGLSACWFIVARYTLDFALLMMMGSVVCIDTALERISGLVRRPALLKGVVMVLACYSMLLGLALGLEGKDGAFRKQNPKVYQWLATPFGKPRA